MTVTINGTTGIAGVDGSAGTPSVQGADTNTGMFFPAADTIAFAEGGAEVMRIDSSGNVGIGTSSPYAPNGKNISLYDASGIAARLTLDCQGQKKWSISSDYDGALNFRDNSTGTDRARIDSSGRFFVGTTSTWANAVFEAKTPASTWGISGYNINSGYGAFLARVDATNSNMMAFYYGASTQVGLITTNGTNTTYGTSSDERLKENIVDAPSASSIIGSIKIRSFDWKSNGSHQEFGVVAQELLPIAPEAVQVPSDPEAMMGVDYSKLVPALIKYVQELKAQNDELKARVEALEAK
jgi:hypothetical protein